MCAYMASAVAHTLIQKSLVGEAIDGAPVAVFVADDDGKYLAVNQYACDLLGYARAELLELRVTDVAVNETAAADYGTMRREGTSSGRTTLRSKDGTEIEMRFRAGSTTVGGLTMYVGVCWPADEPA